MRRFRSRTTWAFISLGASIVLGCFAACSSTSDHPAANGDSNKEAGVGTNAEGGTEASTVPATCNNATKDGAETDIDCGGDACLPCALGKACVANKDCSSGGTCTNKICSLCSDNKSDGDETDVDCGGKACGPCTIGKRCKVADDCKSGACTNDACACPKDMTIVSLAGGGAYCVDSSEVSKGEYNKFITANVPVSSQTDACGAVNDAGPPVNDTFVPRGAWPPATSPGPLEFNLGLPVHYVDWCDAVAYCKWARKELCGQIGGGPVAQASATDPVKSAWFNACSAQGTKTFPYGAIPYDATKCNGNGLQSDAGVPVEGLAGTKDQRDIGFGYGSNQDDSLYAVAVSDVAGNVTNPDHRACQGGSVGVFQMSGNVAEWENSCDGPGASANCSVRGGSYAAHDAPAQLMCNADRKVVRMPPAGGAGDALLKDIGIRCCQY
jgi:formylglycine-generating enzyme required for sulfatase activity